MRKLFALFALGLGCLGALNAAAPAAPPKAPAAAAFLPQVRKDHPRLFLTREMIPQWRERAKTVAKADFDALIAKVDAYPDQPKLQFKTDVCTVEGKKITFKRLLNDQNACVYAIETSGGIEAANCALAWVLTGEEKYRRKAHEYIKMNVEFIEYCHASRILYEWFHFSRMGAIVAYDWIAETLTPEERAAIVKPFLAHVEFMRKPGFLYNDGGPRDGNYGDPALMWYLGVAAYGDGIGDPELTEKMLRDGYELFCKMMDHRDHISGGSGVLTSICSGYSFGAYPFSTFNFLHTLKSAAGIDGTQFWTQPRDYANWFNWASIPGDDFPREYGLGDSYHLDNRMPSANMYTHLAQVIHFYGQSSPERADLARYVMKSVPGAEQQLKYWNCPWLPFLLTGFDPAARPQRSREAIFGGKTAEYFPNFGLSIMRSGNTPGDTYAAFKAGSKFHMHQHYDENSFILYHRGFQALDTGNRGSKEHHLVYYPQTVAHNAMLIRMDKEPLANYWYPANAPKFDRTQVFNDGGQCRQLAGYNLGFYQDRYYAATAGDATDCYAKAKCREAVRFFVFVPPSYFIVYDRVESVRPEQAKVFLLHTQQQPVKLAENLWKSSGGEGALFTRTLLPQSVKTELIGGPGKEFWVNGKNYPAPIWGKFSNANSWLGQWRLEVQPAVPAAKDRFLHLLETASADSARPVAAKLLQDADFDGLEFTTTTGREVRVTFRRTGAPEGFITIREAGKTLVDQRLFPANPPKEVRRYADPAPPKKPVKREDCARVDFIHRGEGGTLAWGDVGNSLDREIPSWYGNGRGALTHFAGGSEWSEGQLELKVRKPGDVLIKILGPDLRNPDKTRRKRQVEFARIRVNGKDLLPSGKTVTVWHDAPQVYPVAAKDGDTLKIEVKFRMVQ